MIDKKDLSELSAVTTIHTYECTLHANEKDDEAVIAMKSTHDELATSGMRNDSTASATNVIIGLPAYNEEVAIGSVVIAAQQYGDEVVVVDDGSSDRTVEIARGAGATVIEHEQNRGKGGAVKTLFKFANEVNANALVMLDADGQHIPADIPSVVAPILDEKADVVIGSRYLERRPEDETPLYRRLGQRMLDILTTGYSGVRLTDSQSGFRAFSSDALNEIHVVTDSIAVESETIQTAIEKELRIKEVPIDVRYDGIDGQTYNPIRHGFIVVGFVLSLVHDRHPLIFFGIPGLLMTLIGGMYWMDAVQLSQQTGEPLSTMIIVPTFVMNLGALCLLSALILNSVNNTLTQTDN